MSGSAIEISRSQGALGGAWRQAVSTLSTSTLAHAPEWLTVIRRAYGHEPLYLTAQDDEGRGGVLPAFIVRRPFFGTVVASMPFLDAGGPCTASPALAHALADQLMAEAERVGARFVEFRSTGKLDLVSPPMEHKVNLTLQLPVDSGGLWRQIDASTRNKVRKAERAGLSVEFGGVEKLKAFYDVFAVRMRDLGSPVHAPGFLRAVLETFGDGSRIGLVRKGSTPVAGLLAIAFKDRLVVPWSSCLKDYFSLGTNVLLYWEVLRAACAEGICRFDFGRSTRNSGTYHFKRQWGAQEEPLFWYTLPVAPHRATHVASRTTRVDFAAKVWRRVPLSVTRGLGPSIRRYLTQ